MSTRVETGEECRRCQRTISFFSAPPGHPRLCGSCELLDMDADEVTHDDYIRCPACGHQDNIGDWDCDYGEEKYTEGHHDVFCGECGIEYEIQTHVSYSYTSPARRVADEKEEHAGRETEGVK